MWLFTTQGFYSVVEHRDDPQLLIVRSRAREDLEALREQIPELELIEDDQADYQWRAIVTREQWDTAVSELTEGIDYPNFKDAVRDSQGDARSFLYGEIWLILRQLQEDLPIQTGGRDALRLIDALDDIIHEGTPVPLTDQLRVDREEIYDLLDRLRVSLPEEITHARAWLSAAKLQARRIIDDAGRASEKPPDRRGVSAGNRSRNRGQSLTEPG